MHKAAEEAMAPRASVWGQNTGIALLARSLGPRFFVSLFLSSVCLQFPQILAFLPKTALRQDVTV